ncbi:MAG: hypothetical protein A2151_05885 [Candidatus Muproteobacteria bacterium RBG_16_65_34]|uniref:DUF3307 domain-containing protein n=1 Tax=Candidatus Muproteobacteria bacterium RBG_16_65_34 TaxID=1817760 RepID=A0A1F6TNF1_9PROT|nr:MAG: hypothetical protein A2151_05885 [Candidatus Muproteobacteria bacterium RBG_16_65_34]
MEQILAHLVGDYILQTSHMAENKIRSWPVAILHAFVYSLPFTLITLSPAALAVIFGTHAVIDRYRLAHYVAMAKNMAGDPRHWRDFHTYTGYADSTPAWLSVWLVIVTDNTMHLLCNYFAIRYL